jgi:hypothetical protein
LRSVFNPIFFQIPSFKKLKNVLPIFQDPKRNVSVKGASVFCFNEPKCFQLRIRENHRQGKQQSEPKGQLNSELINEVIISLKMQTKNYKDFYPTIQTRIVALLFYEFFDECMQFIWLRSLIVR